MDNLEKIAVFYKEEHPFKKGTDQLRQLALKAGLTEAYKWNFPTYTMDHKNLLAICRFKSYFGLWFFNGVYLTDPEQVLENAQEGKTKAMRHWKFHSNNEIKPLLIDSYIKEAIENQKKGLVIKIMRKPKKEIELPEHLSLAFKTNNTLKAAFYALTEFKQREFIEYLQLAKLEKTKIARLTKITSMILEGTGLNDRYRK